MRQWLQRGFEVKNGVRIKKKRSEANNWQIYDTNVGSYVLIVQSALYSSWKKADLLPGPLFDKYDDYWVLISSPGYIIASLDKGPYPDNSTQIEAFALAFKTSRIDGFSMEHAIYIEEYSLILPAQNGNMDEETVFGRWITGGIGVSVNSFDQVCRAMTWIPEEKLKILIEMAGFKEPQTKEIIDGSNKEDDMDDCYSHIPAEPFKLIGRKDLETFINENIIEVLKNKEEYERMGIKTPGAIVLCGPPGCGKTYAVERLVEYLKWNRFDINSNSIASPYIHETGRKIAEVFDAAIADAPSILVIDEMEAYLSNRLERQTHDIEEVAEFLRKIPEASSKGVLIFAMTNMIESIDKAIIRKGRFDHIVEVKLAKKEDVKELLEEEFKKIPVQDVDVIVLSEKLEKHPLSDISFVIKQAGRIAVKKKQKVISQNCFEEAIAMLKSSEKRSNKTIGFSVRSGKE